MKGSREELPFLTGVADGKHWKILPLRATWKCVAVSPKLWVAFPSAILLPERSLTQTSRDVSPGAFSQIINLSFL